MQVFKTFWKIALKRFPSILMYVVIYVFVTVLISSIIGANDEKSFSGSSIDISIMDSDNSVLSKGLTEYMSKGNNVVELENDKEVMQDALFFRNVDYILQIPEGFEESFVNGGDKELTNIKIPSSRTGTFTDNLVYEYLNTVRLYLAGGDSIEEAAALAAEACSNDTEVTVVDFNESLASDSSIYYIYAYMPYGLLMILICGLCPIIITMNSDEISKRTLCSAITKRNFSMQIILAGLLYGLAVWLVFIVIGLVMNGSEMFTLLGFKYMLNSIAFLAVTAGIAVFLSGFELKVPVVTMLANVIGLGMCFICGIFVPQWLLGEQIVNMSKILPAYWYVKAVNMLSGSGGEVYTAYDYNICILIQVLFAILLFACSFAVSKRKQRA